MEDFHVDFHNQWIAVNFSEYTFVGIYAHGPQKERVRIVGVKAHMAGGPGARPL